jgi:DNA-binding XRE family transcriptional regulator
MAQNVILFTDRPAFASNWAAACQEAGLTAQTAAPDSAADMLRGGLTAVFDADSEAFDEDELLACIGLSRALGAVTAVALPEGQAFKAIEDVLNELCGGLVVRGDQVARITQGLARRTDPERGLRFEYLSVSPRGSDLLAILGDGTTILLSRPLGVADDGSEVSQILLAEDARAAQIEFASGQRFSVSAAQVADRVPAAHGNGASAAGDVPASLGDVDGVRLGQRLRALRLAAGLTQAELARRTGIHRPNIARVEAGRHTPSLETLARLAAAIGVPTTRVLSG